MEPIVATTPQNRDDLNREEDDFFSNIVRDGTAGEYDDWEKRANGFGDMLPGERFHLRFINKNFDGVPLDRWIVFCNKPPCSVHPGRNRVITVMTIEEPGSVGTFSAPRDVHLDALRVVVLDWREGRQAALDRLEEMKAQKEATRAKDVISEAEGHVDEMFWVWKRTMGENLGLRLGPDGTGPNRGGKYFGQVFDRVE